MDNISYIALSSQTALMRKLESTANNMANMNTVGYKGEEPLFVQYIAKTKDTDKTLGQNISFVNDFGMSRNLNEGELIKTGNPLDLAIKNKGYFALQTQQGEKYTRSGQFMLDNNGQIVSADGYPVMSEDGTSIFIPEEAKSIDIGADGTVSTNSGIIGKIRIVECEKENELLKIHSGLYETKEDNLPQNITNPMLEQGMLEGSNVNSITEITKMIEIQRAFEGITKMIEQESERQKKSIDVLEG